MSQCGPEGGGSHLPGIWAGRWDAFANPCPHESGEMCAAPWLDGTWPCSVLTATAICSCNAAPICKQHNMQPRSAKESQ